MYKKYYVYERKVIKLFALIDDFGGNFFVNSCHSVYTCQNEKI